MNPPVRNDPSRQEVDRKRQASINDARQTKRCIRPPPVLIPTRAAPVPLAPIAPAPRQSAGTLATVPAPALQAAHQAQHTLAGAGSYHQSVCSAQQLLQRSKLRSGKWNACEEEYADMLIEFFDKGLAIECENGMTLRSFLSRKLHCSPMRISKKYAGKGIGKKVFLSKGNTNVATCVETRALIAKLQLAEAKFYTSLFPAANWNPPLQMDTVVPSSSAFFSQAMSGLVPFPTLVPSGTTQPMASLTMPTFRPLEALTADVPAGPHGHGMHIPILPLVKAEQIQKPETAVTSVSSVVTSTAHQEVQGVPVTSPLVPVPASERRAGVGVEGTDYPQDDHTVKLKQSYFTALEGIKEATKRGEESEMHPTGADKSLQSQLANVERMKPAITTTVLTAEILHTTSTKLGQPLPRRVGAQVVDEHSYSGSSVTHTGDSTQSERVRVIDNKSASASSTKELPDLLAGFDLASGLDHSHEKSNHGERKGLGQLAMARDSAYQYSPPFASRSFDDFHRFLGKDLAPLNNEATSAQAERADNAEGCKSERMRESNNDVPPHPCTSSKTGPSCTQSSSLRDPYQQLSVATSDHSAFSPHVGMFDTTNEHLFYSALSGALGSCSAGGGKEKSLEDGKQRLYDRYSNVAAAFSPYRAASVVSGSERSASDYFENCSSKGSVHESESIEWSSSHD